MAAASGGFRVGGNGGMHPLHQPKHNVHMNNTQTYFKKSNQWLVVSQEEEGARK